MNKVMDSMRIGTNNIHTLQQLSKLHWSMLLDNTNTYLENTHTLIYFNIFLFRCANSGLQSIKKLSITPKDK